jgi:hypothetical protein
MLTSLTHEFPESCRECVGLLDAKSWEGYPALGYLALRRLRIAARLVLTIATVEASECVESFSMETLAVYSCRAFSGKEIAAAFPVSMIECCKKMACSKAGSATPRF